MENKIEYHFNVVINFECDVDVHEIAKGFEITPYKLTLLKDSRALKGFKKVAKMWYKTNDFTNLSVNNETEKFVLKAKEIFKNLPSLLKEFQGNCHFEIVFTKLDRFPIIALSQKTIEALNFLQADFGTDFILKS